MSTDIYNIACDLSPSDISPEGTITRTLEALGVETTLLRTLNGPTTIRYILEMKPGGRVSTIRKFHAEIAAALGVESARVITPLQGVPNGVAVEIPRDKRLPHFLTSLPFDTLRQDHPEMTLPVFVGRTVEGIDIVHDLAKGPHTLIAGASGMGKSACLDQILVSLCLNFFPEDLKLVLIDLKQVGLAKFRDSHLTMFGVQGTATAANDILARLINMMESRHDLYMRDGVENITQFNKAFPDRKHPHYVVVVDELQNLLADELQGPIAKNKLAKLSSTARACGIHLIISTQHPSAQTLPTSIRNNLTARLIFATADATASRVALGQSGAENLLGDGDLLFTTAGIREPLRCQGPYISNGDIYKLMY